MTSIMNLTIVFIWDEDAFITANQILDRAEDPRSRILKKTAKELGSPRVEVAEALEEAAHQAIAT